MTFYKRLTSIIVPTFITWLVFEETIYGYTNITPTSYLYLKLLPELFLYAILALLIYNRAISGHISSYKPSTFDYALVFFVLLSFLSTLLNDGSFLMAALNIRTSLRYVAIYYIIVLSGSLPSPHYLRMLLGYVILLALIQSSINAVQHIMGDEFRDKYFGGPDIELELSSIHTLITDKLDKMGAAYGTFGKAAPAAFFMMIVIIYAAINAVRTNKILESYKWWLIYISLLVGIFLTYKRAAFIIALLVPLITAYILKRTQFVVRYIIFSAAGASLFFIFGSLEQNEYVREKSTAISPYESIQNLMTEEYWSIAFTKSRGWMLTEVSREVMASFKPLGYGADEMNAKAQLATLGGEFAKLLSFGAFDDVFIVACLVYYGPVGLILLLLAFYDLRLRAVRLYKHSDLEYKQIALMIMIAILILLPAAFVERILEFRALSFLLWSLCGYVAVAERHRLR